MSLFFDLISVRKCTSILAFAFRIFLVISIHVLLYKYSKTDTVASVFSLKTLLFKLQEQ